VRGAAGSKAPVTFRNVRNVRDVRNGGETSPRTVQLTAVEEPEEPKPFNVIADVLFGSPVEVRRLAAGPGYIRIKFELPALLDLHPERDVARALERFHDAKIPGLILDVRGNAGGQDAMIARLAAFFQRTERTYEMAAVYDLSTQGFVPRPETLLRLVPREPRWEGKVAVLVDADTLSSGEGIPLALRGLPGVAIFGWHGTQGSFGINQKTIHLPASSTWSSLRRGRSMPRDESRWTATPPAAAASCRITGCRSTRRRSRPRTGRGGTWCWRRPCGGSARPVTSKRRSRSKSETRRNPARFLLP